jgi:hypothetical protein
MVATDGGDPLIHLLVFRRRTTGDEDARTLLREFAHDAGANPSGAPGHDGDPVV